MSESHLYPHKGEREGSLGAPPSPPTVNCSPAQLLTGDGVQPDNRIVYPNSMLVNKDRPLECQRRLLGRTCEGCGPSPYALPAGSGWHTRSTTPELLETPSSQAQKLPQICKRGRRRTSLKDRFDGFL